MCPTRNNPRYVNEWDLPAGTEAASGSRVSYSGTGVGSVTIGSRTVALYRWIFLEEPGANGRIIGVPVIANQANNGGLDTGDRDNVMTIIGGVNQRRTQTLPVAVLGSNGQPFAITALRTILNHIVRDAFAEVAREVSGYRMRNATAGANRPTPGGNRTHNHPNAVAIDVNWGPLNDGGEHSRRRELGINSQPGFQYLNSLDVELILERHGLRLGYAGDSPGLTTNGFMHWSISRT